MGHGQPRKTPCCAESWQRAAQHLSAFRRRRPWRNRLLSGFCVKPVPASLMRTGGGRRGGPRSAERGGQGLAVRGRPGGLARSVHVSSPPAWSPGIGLVPSGLSNGPAPGVRPSRRPSVRPTGAAVMTSYTEVRGAARGAVDDPAGATDAVAYPAGDVELAGCGPLDRGPTPTSATCSPS